MLSSRDKCTESCRWITVEDNYATKERIVYCIYCKQYYKLSIEKLCSKNLQQKFQIALLSRVVAVQTQWPRLFSRVTMVSEMLQRCM